MAKPRIWFDPPTFSWARVLRIGTLWLAIVLASSVSMQVPGPQGNAAAPHTQDVRAGHQPAASAPLRMALAASTPAAAASAARIRAAATREVEACGSKRLSAAADAAPAVVLGQLNTREVRQRSAAALRASATESGRALALLLDGDAPIGTVRGWDGVALDGLVNKAASSSDARLYGFAFNSCSSTRPPLRGACRQLSPNEWARLDPDNAVPWLVVAEQAHRRRDASGVSEAMLQVAKARRSDEGAGVALSLLLKHAPDEEAGLLPTLRLLTELIGAQAAWALPTGSMVRTFCSADALRDPSRRQTCSDIAELLVHRSTSLLEHAAGAEIGRRIGWSEERLQAVNAERDAIAEVMNRALGADADAFSCAWARRNLAHFRSVAELGELEAGRQAIGQSGKGVEEWAMAFRERAKNPQPKRPIVAPAEAAASTR